MTPLPKLKKYDKKFDHSYVFGTYPVLDLINKKPDQTIEVLLNPNANDSEIIREIASTCAARNIPCDFNAKAIDRLAIKENTYAIGVFKKYETKLRPNQNTLMLVNPSNMGNIGTIIRTMIGFEVYNLAIIKPAADIFDPKVLRSTMGAFFDLNFEFYNSIEEYISQNKSNNLYSFMLNADKDLNSCKFSEPFTLIFGNEGSGLPENYRNLSTTIEIKHNKKIDSLNLSVCAGIVLNKLYK